jgi:tRNA(Ile)-lysidine synthase TilS/MesJ/rhodanese-related sulfurtransferase
VEIRILKNMMRKTGLYYIIRFCTENGINIMDINNLEISVSEFAALPTKEYTLIDVRDELSFSYGHLEGAVNIPMERLLESGAAAGDYSGKAVVYCKKGEISLDAAQLLRQNGVEAYSLQGGYMAWLIQDMESHNEDDDEDFCDEVEKSIRKRFKKRIWSKFTRAINEYELVQPGDKIAVCISGGKDSMLMAKLFQELKRHNKFEFEVKFLVMDPGYSPENRKVIENNAKRLNIPITVFESDIFESVFNVEKSPCYLCARMRRGHLYSKAKEMGCNKIALGHHYDDVIETILMGMLYGAQMQTMMPKLHSTNFEGMELIRPLYLVREDDIKAWRDANNLTFIQCACKFTDTCSSCQDDGQSNSKRLEVKKLIRELKKTNPFVEGNIFKSVENVNLSTVIAYKKDGVKHHFLDEY